MQLVSYAIFIIIGIIGPLVLVRAVQPVNRYFSAENPEKQPDLECLVGMDSADISELYKVKCTEAWNISIKYERATASEFASKNYISEHDRRLRTLKFGIQGSGIKYNSYALWKNWTNVDNWVCSYFPISSVLIYDCIPENQAPPWWKQPLMGPAFPTGHKPAPKEMRYPGCNGGVCYCNGENYCNDRHKVVHNDDECPVDQPHHKWDQRCKSLETSDTEAKVEYLKNGGFVNRLDMDHIFLSVVSILLSRHCTQII